MHILTAPRDRLATLTLVGFRPSNDSLSVRRANGAKVGNNGLPPITAPSTLTVTAGVAKSFTVSAPDNNIGSSGTETVTLKDATGILHVTATTGVTGNSSNDLVLTASTSVIATELQTLTVKEASVADNGDTIHISDTDSANSPSASATISITVTACYLRGSLITTPHGPVPIEALAIDDVVMTASGNSRPIKWIGRTTHAGAFCRTNPNILPICITAGALAEHTPHTDLYVSPCHAMLLDGVLVPARELVNGTTIRQVDTLDQIDYFHLELHTHDIIIANSALSESYLDEGNRRMFNNAGDVAAISSDFEANPPRTCAPRIEAGPLLDAIRAHLAARARAHGFVPPLTHEITLEDTEITRAVIPAGAEEIHLLSLSGRPHGDARVLGALIAGLWLDGAPIDLADPALTRGFHPLEQHGVHQVRWTNGAGVLRIPPSPADQTLEIRATTRFALALAA